MNANLPNPSPLSHRRPRNPNLAGSERANQLQQYREAVRDRRIQLVLMLMDENSHRHLLMQDLAIAVNLSPGRLAHLFKNEVGISLQRCLNDLRLEKAKGHLEDSALSIKEIAAAIGFPNVSHFCRSFRDRFGGTPTEYRNANLKMAAGKERFLLARANPGR